MTMSSVIFDIELKNMLNLTMMKPTIYFTLITLFVSRIVMQSLILEMMLIQLTLQTQAWSIYENILF